MIPYKTLEVYLERIEMALSVVEDGIVRHEKGLVELKEQRIAVTAQKDTILQLMDVENNPPVVELPFAGPEDIEELHERRLDPRVDMPPEEIYEARQDTVYRGEAMETVEKLDAADRSQKV